MFTWVLCRRFYSRAMLSGMFYPLSNIWEIKLICVGFFPLHSFWLSVDWKSSNGLPLHRCLCHVVYVRTEAKRISLLSNDACMIHTLSSWLHFGLGVAYISK
jgi:hypothetical protein